MVPWGSPGSQTIPLAETPCPRYTSATMSKPAGFQLTVLVLWVFVVAGVLVAAFAPVPVPATPGAPPMAAEIASKIQLPAALFGAVIASIFVFCYSKGMSWARWVIMIASLFYLVGGLVGLMSLHKSPAHAVLGLVEALFAVYLLYYLNTPPVRAWFNESKA